MNNIYMKHFLLVFFIIGLGMLGRAQQEYEVSTDGTNKILKGLISRDLPENDTAFRWFHANQAGYVPNPETVTILKARGADVRFVVFFGTWCEDSQILLPKFYALMDAASIGRSSPLSFRMRGMAGASPVARDSPGGSLSRGILPAFGIRRRGQADRRARTRNADLHHLQ